MGVARERKRRREKRGKRKHIKKEKKGGNEWVGVLDCVKQERGKKIKAKAANHCGFRSSMDFGKMSFPSHMVPMTKLHAQEERD